MKDKLLDSLGLPIGVLFCDKHNLDVEFEKHPGHIYSVIEALAEAHLEKERRKVSLFKAEAAARTKVQEKTQEKRLLARDLELLVMTDPKVLSEEEELQDINYKIEIIGGVLSALQAKTSSLKHLSELSQSSYYVSNSSSGRARLPPDRKRGD